MKKILSPWSKAVKKAMIDNDMDTNDLAQRLEYTRQYTSNIINGCIYYEDAVIKISNVFQIPVPVPGATLAKKENAQL